MLRSSFRLKEAISHKKIVSRRTRQQKNSLIQGKPMNTKLKRNAGNND
jgi:predicted GIY-YIG superfamily endonuclease